MPSISDMHADKGGQVEMSATPLRIRAIAKTLQLHKTVFKVSTGMT